MANLQSQAMASLPVSTPKIAAPPNGTNAAPAQIGGSVPVLKHLSCAPKQRAKTVCQAANIAADRVPDMGKRNLMNLLLLGALSLPTGSLIVGYGAVFVPPGSGSGEGGVVAKDALGNDINASAYLKTHPPGDRTLAQGLKGDPTYLVVENDGQLATYGINAVCTHLGCVVPWNAAENKYICPCHGSQYNGQGKVVRGPAPLSLALAHADIVDDNIVFVPWTETDFRTGQEPWWS